MDGSHDTVPGASSDRPRLVNTARGTAYATASPASVNTLQSNDIGGPNGNRSTRCSGLVLPLEVLALGCSRPRALRSSGGGALRPVRRT